MNVMERIWIHSTDGKDAKVILVTETGITIVNDIGESTKARAEIKAIIMALEYLKSERDDDEKKILYTDSDIVFGQLIKGWKITSNASLSWKAKKLFRKAKRNILLKHIDKKDNLAMKVITREI